MREQKIVTRMMETEVAGEFLDCCAAGGPQGTWKLEYLLI